ncbi:MAG: hypothetical protein LBP61_00625 [Desulfovibrio sp.]|nr:hypothetical protein [Desulfovibrio sp.]
MSDYAISIRWQQKLSEKGENGHRQGGLGDEAAGHPAEDVVLRIGDFGAQFGFGRRQTSFQVRLGGKILPPFFVGAFKHMGDDGLFDQRLFKLFGIVEQQQGESLFEEYSRAGREWQDAPRIPAARKNQRFPNYRLPVGE